MTKKFIKHILSFSAATFVYAVVCIGESVPSVPVPDSSIEQGNEETNDETASLETGNETDISPQNDDETLTTITE